MNEKDDFSNERKEGYEQKNWKLYGKPMKENRYEQISNAPKKWMNEKKEWII
jgi:hypothetical protein